MEAGIVEDGIQLEPLTKANIGQGHLYNVVYLYNYYIKNIFLIRKIQKISHFILVRFITFR